MAKRIPAADFAAFLKERQAAGDGYIFGAVGQNPRELPEWYFTGQYSGARLEKALYWRANARRVWDCNGLAEGYYRDVTGVDIDARARDNYASWCEPRGEGAIPAERRVPGAAVFKRAGYIHHVGFLVEPVRAGAPEGDWYVIEARGVMSGVVRSRLGENDWNCWGLMTRYFDYGGALAAPAPGGGTARLLKPGARGADVRQLQETLISLGFDLGTYGADGIYGAEMRAAVRRLQAAQGVAADGIFGPDTRAALARAVAREEPRGDAGDEEAAAARVRVTADTAANVRLGPGLSYPVRATALRGAEFALVSTAANGWHGVAMDGATGWISPNLSEVIRNG